MASSSTQKRLPVLYESIYVLFNMPENINMWWKTKVEAITIQQDNTIRAIAQVNFDSGSDNCGNYYAEEKGEMHFLNGDSATLLSAHSSFSTGSETTWRLDSEMGQDDVTNITNSKRVRRIRSCTNNKGNKRHNRDRDVAKKNGSVGKRGLQRQRLRKGAKQEPTTYENESSTSIDLMHTDAKMSPVTQPQIAIAVNNLNSLYSTLQREVSALQKKVSSMDRARIIQFQSKKTKEKRIFLKHELMRQQKRSLTLTSGETSFPFSSTFRRFPYEFSIDCTLKDFAEIATDINNQFDNGVIYLPALPTITAESQPLTQKHIIFHNCNSLLTWIGIKNGRERELIMKQFLKRKGTSVLQALGGTHWDIENDQRSLHFFYTHSSSRALPNAKREQDNQPVTETEGDVTHIATTDMNSGDVRTLSLRSAQWDNTNGCFLNEFNESSACSCIHRINSINILDFDAFTLSWKPLKGLRSHDISSTVNDNDPIVPGKLVVYIPAVLFFGDHLTTKVSSMLWTIMESPEEQQ